MAKRREDEHLCDTCKWGSRVTDNQNNSIHRCRLFDKDFENPISFCTEYTEKGKMNLYNMKEMAILINLDKPGQIGFIRPGSEQHKDFVRSSDLDNLADD